MIYLLLLLPIIIAPIEAYVDVLNSRKKKIEHNISAAVRVLVSVLVSFIWLTNYLDMFLYMSMLLTLYWIVFDIFNNIFYTRNWLYIGETAELDKLARKYVGLDFRLFLITKITLFLFFMLMFYINA